LPRPDAVLNVGKIELWAVHTGGHPPSSMCEPEPEPDAALRRHWFSGGLGANGRPHSTRLAVASVLVQKLAGFELGR
jgi:hypothetical protein